MSKCPFCNFFFFLLLHFTATEGARSLYPRENILRTSSEPHLQNLVPLITGGVNAEAYFNSDGTKLSFQAIRSPTNTTMPCDQIFSYDMATKEISLVSNPAYGRTTCAYYAPDSKSIFYSSTQSGGLKCPPTPDPYVGYVWPIYKTMQIYQIFPDLSQRNITHEGLGYNAELTFAPDGSRAVFTSTRDGDLELYSMDPSGGDVQRLTYSPGYDGGAFFSMDSSMLVWRANRPQGQDLITYFENLNFGIVEPWDMQLYVANADGTNARRVATFNGTSFAPYFLPDNSGLIFSSNMDDPYGGTFHLYTVRLDGSGLTRITSEGTFNSFPMFHPNKKELVFASNRAADSYYGIDIFMATWAP